MREFRSEVLGDDNAPAEQVMDICIDVCLCGVKDLPARAIVYVRW